MDFRIEGRDLRDALNDRHQAFARAQLINSPSELIEWSDANGVSDTSHGAAALGHVLPDVDADVARQVGLVEMRDLAAVNERAAESVVDDDNRRIRDAAVLNSRTERALGDAGHLREAARQRASVLEDERHFLGRKEGGRAHECKTDGDAARRKGSGGF